MDVHDDGSERGMSGSGESHNVLEHNVHERDVLERSILNRDAPERGVSPALVLVTISQESFRYLIHEILKSHLRNDYPLIQ